MHDEPSRDLAVSVASAATSPSFPLKAAWRQVIRELSSLPRAISIMFAIAFFSGLGTVVPQNKVRPLFLIEARVEIKHLPTPQH